MPSLRISSQLLYFWRILYLFLYAVRDYQISLEQISLNILIEVFTKIIKKWDIKLWYQLLYFLHNLHLVFKVAREHPLPFDHISLNILLEYFIKIIKLWDLRLCSKLFYFLHGIDLIHCNVSILINRKILIRHNCFFFTGN
jgi:hypothetical protein